MLLKEAQRPAAEITLASLEENLYWLVQMAIPDVPASASLRQRIQVSATVQRFWQRWWPTRFWREEPPHRLATTPLKRSVDVHPGEVIPQREVPILQLLLAADVHRLPADALLDRQVGDMMRQLLERLPEPQREALLLQVRHGLSVHEIAHVLGRSEAQTDDLLQQARAMLFRYSREPFKS